MESSKVGFSKTLNRRGLLGLMAGATVAVATGSFVREASANSGVAYTTTAALNLRKKANSTSTIIQVIPNGAAVIDYDGEVVNGYRSIDYGGSVGWVLNSYLVQGYQEPVIIGGAKTTSNVNLRKGPGSNFAVIKVVPKGTWVEITASVQNGFRKVLVDGYVGWISDAFLGGDDEGAFITTAKVNLRSGAGTSYSIKQVLPSGATVVDYDDDIVNGFRHVEYKGTTGWVSNAYLTKA